MMKATHPQPATLDPQILDAWSNLLTHECSPAQVRAIERQPQGEAAQALWRVLDESGLLDVMLPESAGGAGLQWPQVFELLARCGQHAVPLPLAQTLVARGLLARSSDAERRARASEHRFDEEVGWSEIVEDSQQAMSVAALVDAALMSGAMQRVLSMTLRHANEREQFGRPIGKFQAIQHQLAVMAEQCVAAQMAARLGCGLQNDLGLPDPDRVAVAKARCAEAAVEVTAIAHAVHGAIGFTAAFDLQLFTRRLHHWRQRSGTESFWQRQLGRQLLRADSVLRPEPSLHAVRRLTESPSTP